MKAAASAWYVRLFLQSLSYSTVDYFSGGVLLSLTYVNVSWSPTTMVGMLATLKIHGFNDSLKAGSCEAKIKIFLLILTTHLDLAVHASTDIQNILILSQNKSRFFKVAPEVFWVYLDFIF